MPALISPVKRFFITQYFGQNPAMYARFGMKGHNGLDFRTVWPDTPHGHVYVYPIHPQGGVVVGIKNEGHNGYGISVRLNHPDGSQTVYGHLLKTYVLVGQKVSSDTVIGLTDNTGFSTGSHLHVGYRPPNWQSIYNNGFKGYVDFYSSLKKRV